MREQTDASQAEQGLDANRSHRSFEYGVYQTLRVLTPVDAVDGERYHDG
jgi:hypothetical protein